MRLDLSRLLLPWCVLVGVLSAACSVEFDERCASGDDCAAGEVCDPEHRYCVPGRADAEPRDLPDASAPDASVPDAAPEPDAALPFPPPGVPGGPCEVNDDCPLATLCDPSFKICVQGCAESPNICGDFAQCGPLLPGGDSLLCRVRCDREDRWSCWPGWACEPDPAGEGDVCLPACWHPDLVGCQRYEECGANLSGFNRCGADEQCDPVSGRCLTLQETPCPFWPCQPGERCLRDVEEDAYRCVHEAGRCTTDYNCFNERPVCHRGQCIETPGEKTCEPGAGACPEGMACGARTPGAVDGRCQPACAEDADCPAGYACRSIYPEESPVCIESLCGGANDNGEVYGACALNPDEPGETGTCFSIGLEGNGICAAAGVVEEGGRCDAQLQSLSERTAELQCAPGLLCVGDTDFDDLPRRPQFGFGRCMRYCEVGGDQCGLGQTCSPLFRFDQAGRPTDEEREGVCVRRECIVGTELDGDVGGCEDGETCAPISPLSDRGECRDVLPTPDFPNPQPYIQPCQVSEQCQHGICADRFNFGVPVCVPTCNLRNANSNSCPAGITCRGDLYPGFGLCLPGD